MNGTNYNFETPSDEAREICRLLKNSHNVILSGPPGVGKSRLMLEVKYWFEKKSTANPAYNPQKNKNPLPKDGGEQEIDFIPGFDKKNRKVWDMTFHQGTKNKDFMRGLSPTIYGQFQVTSGPFYEALIHAQKEDSASLIIIDEFNRGPAVAIFGDLLSSIESDKRLSPDGTKTNATLSTYVLNDEGDSKPIFIPYHLYILTCMNEADTSVEPIDIAFRRRFQNYRLSPNYSVLNQYFSIAENMELPEAPSDPGHVYKALVSAFIKVNDFISWTRADEFQVGHGVIMLVSDTTSLPRDLPGAISYASDAWGKIYAYLREIYYSDTKLLSEVLITRSGYFSLKDKLIGENHSFKLEESKRINHSNVYQFLKEISS